MLKLGYKASAEQFAPSKLLDFAVMAEQVGLDQAGGDRRRLVAVAPGGGEQGGRVLDQVGGPVSYPFAGIRHRVTSSVDVGWHRHSCLYSVSAQAGMPVPPEETGLLPRGDLVPQDADPLELDLDHVVSTLLADMRARGVEVDAPDDPHHDEAWVAAVSGTYGRRPPQPT